MLNKKTISIPALTFLLVTIYCLVACEGRLRPVFDFADKISLARVTHEVALLDLSRESHKALLGSGWSRGGLNLKRSFVWAHATTATVNLTLIDTDFKAVIFRCRPFTYFGAPQQRVRVTINDINVGETILKHRFAIYTLPVPPKALHKGKNLLTFHFSYATSPNDRVEGSTDRRSLAASFTSVGLGELSNDLEIPEPPREQTLPQESNMDLVVPEGSSIDYTISVPHNAILEVGLDPRVNNPNLNGAIWVTSEGMPPKTLLTTGQMWAETDQKSYCDRKQISLDAYGGRILTLGFTTFSGSSGTSSGNDSSIVWQQPRLLSRAEIPDVETSVILIVADTLRADHLSCYGGSVSTPNIDSLASSGVLFEKAYSHIPITGPSHATLFTGQLPFEHGVSNNGQILSREHQTLAEILHAHYRRTAAFVSLGVLKKKFGIDQGFDEYFDHFALDWYKSAGEINEQVLPWLDNVEFSPLFAWIHYSDPHKPYAPPTMTYPRIRIQYGDQLLGIYAADGHGVSIPVRIGAQPVKLTFSAEHGPLERSLSIRNWVVQGAHCTIEPLSGFTGIKLRSKEYFTELPATILLSCSDSSADAHVMLSIDEVLNPAEIHHRYAEEVAYLDQKIGRLIATLKRTGLWQTSLIILTADHGESLGGHNHVGHIHHLYDSSLHVPLIMVQPGRIDARKVVETPVGLIDLSPTILEILRIEKPSAMVGQSMLPLLKKPALRPVMAMTYKPESSANLQGVVMHGYKYILTTDTGVEELYNLNQDPSETVNLAIEQPDKVDVMRSYLSDRVNSAQVQHQSENATLSSEEKSRLRALGYFHDE